MDEDDRRFPARVGLLNLSPLAVADPTRAIGRLISHRYPIRSRNSWIDLSVWMCDGRENPAARALESANRLVRVASRLSRVLPGRQNLSKLGSRADVEFRIDLVQVVLDRAGTDEQRVLTYAVAG